MHVCTDARCQMEPKCTAPFARVCDMGKHQSRYYYGVYVGIRYLLICVVLYASNRRT